ncbi:MAG: HEAT repeat domain-containing protein [Rubripirellula sp.]
MFEESLDQLLGDQADPVAAGWRLRELAETAIDHGPTLLAEVALQAEPIGKSDAAIVGGILRVVHTVMLQAGQETIAGLNIDEIETIEKSLPVGTPNRYLLLHLLATIGSRPSLARLLGMLQQSPPEKWIEAAQVLSPLMQNDDWPTDAVYPELLGAIQHPTLASPILDLANYLVRKQRVAIHPATDRIETLNLLLGEISGRLARFEEDPHTFGDDVDTVQNRLGEAVALAVSLCDTVGMLGQESSVGKLHQALDLKHRRVQCEAAGALARLGDSDGKARLIELTKDPTARLRAIHYADELGLGNRVEEQYRSDTSTAESELSLWLSQPQQMGVPPTSVEVVDTKRMLWPSFTDPVDIHLVRFEYNFGERVYSNVGITGPVTFAMSADVADFAMADIYAIYAGWHAEHPEIFIVAAEHLNEVQIRVMSAFQKHLEQTGYESIKPALLGFFLEEKAGVFMAMRDNKPCAVVTDGLETVDYPVGGRLRPITPGDLFNLYKGRKMLRTFNPTSVDETS